MRYRLFSAIELTPELLARLDAHRAEYKAAGPRGSVRWARSQGLHVTLRFYGAVDQGQMPELQAGLQRAAAAAAPFTLTIQGLGVFPNPQQPQVLWAGLSGDLPPLQQLAAQLEAAAVALGFAPERRAFAPHLTLGRVRDHLRPADLTALMRVVEQAQGQVLGELRADSLSLMSSELRPMGAVYERLFLAPFGLAPAGAA
ncbi:MAG: RNA 2',3'-cyclic phosphodiesterase [Anaerolineales bacterium]|nr:RNA 2',3'-cyclic phosphodiesterase [Anaerolineales bacterium]